MKPEFMRLRRALATTVSALLVGVGLVVLSPALSASAHHNTISATASCVDYVWTITWSVTNSERDKTEEITRSSDTSLVPVGTTIDKSGTYTKTETVSGPVQKTLTLSAKWSNGFTQTNAKTIYPADFTGSCEMPPGNPVIDLSGQACAARGTSAGTLAFSLTGLTAGKSYTVELLQGSAVLATQTSSGDTSYASRFTDLAPGPYTVKAHTAGSQVSSADVSLEACASRPANPVMLLAVGPCLKAGALGAVTAQLSDLAIGSRYAVKLFGSDDVLLDTLSLEAETAGATMSFPGRGPGTYYAALSDHDDHVLATSASTTISLCFDFPTLAPPTIDIVAQQCNAANPHPGTLSAQLGDLDATKTYYVRVVDNSGRAVSGVSDQLVTGVATSTVRFAGVSGPGPYTAQLLVGPNKELAATSPSSVSLDICLPTLAVTGPSVLIPLGGVAALLLTLGGALVTGRLRRRMAL